MIRYGIDVSKHQGNIDWKKVKDSNSIAFAILRAGYGKVISQKDAQFERNYNECEKNQLPVGAYWYSYAMSPEEARQEAEIFLKVLKDKRFAYPVYFDLEEPKQIALGKTRCSAIAEAFLETVEKAGYFTGIYMSKSVLESHMTDELKNRYAVWVAHYGVSQTDYSGQYGMWQKSDTGSVAGISGNVDLNECYQDYPFYIRRAGLNGFAKTAPDTDSDADHDLKEEKYFSVSFDGKTYSGTLTENGKSE